MKFQIIIGVLFMSSAIFAFPKGKIDYGFVKPYGFLEDQINNTIELLRPLLPDPLVIDNLEINLPGSPLAGGFRISKFELTGIQSFQLTDLKINMFGLALDFTLVLPKININTNYWADILLADLIPVYGEGKANIHFEQIVLQGSGRADLSNGISIQDLKVLISIGDATFDIHGLLNNEDFSLILSTILNDVIAKFINENQELISNVVSSIIEVVINAILKGGGSTKAPTLAPTGSPTGSNPTQRTTTTLEPTRTPTSWPTTSTTLEPTKSSWIPTKSTTAKPTTSSDISSSVLTTLLTKWLM